MVQQYSKNSIQENHQHKVSSGIGTFTQCMLCGIHFYFVLFIISNQVIFYLTYVMLLSTKQIKAEDVSKNVMT